jgi:hypothetical protein
MLALIREPDNKFDANAIKVVRAVEKPANCILQSKLAS